MEETLIPESSHLLALAELQLQNLIGYDDDSDEGLYLTEKGYDRAWDYVQNIPQPYRTLITLFFAYQGDEDRDHE